jgi:hypothetical protein
MTVTTERPMLAAEQLRVETRETLERLLDVRLTWPARAPTHLMAHGLRLVLLCASPSPSRFSFVFGSSHRRFLEAESPAASPDYRFVALACGRDALFLIPYREWRRLIPPDHLPGRDAQVTVFNREDRYHLAAPKARRPVLLQRFRLRS